MYITENNFEDLQSFLLKKNYSSIFVLCDENTKEYCLPVLKSYISEFRIIEIESGEKNKSLNVLQFIWQQLINGNANRNSVLINLGGGVITDIGAMAAAVYMRGINFIHVPTTLLCMVDACIGGKAGIDFEGLKNVLGVFAKPVLTITNISFLKTLPDRQIKSGFAEIVKQAMISGGKLFQKLTEYTNQEELADIIELCATAKSEIVEHDFYEQGQRKKLNMGHTIGHAIEEMGMDKGMDILHGEAIAIGLILEARLSNQIGMVSKQQLKEIEDLVLKHCCIAKLDVFDSKEVIQWMKKDKKNTSGKINFSLLQNIGDVKINCEIAESYIISTLNSFTIGNA